MKREKRAVGKNLEFLKQEIKLGEKKENVDEKIKIEVENKK